MGKLGASDLPNDDDAKNAPRPGRVAGLPRLTMMRHAAQ